MLPENQDESQDAQHGRFRFVRLNVHHAAFQQIAREPARDGEERPVNIPMTVQVRAGATINDQQLGVVTLDVSVTPDPKWLPYNIRVVISGAFLGESVAPEQFEQFCHVGVPPILFPYIRETIHRLTMDAQFGSVRLDPINIQAILGSTRWDSVEPGQQESELPNDPNAP